MGLQFDGLGQAIAGITQITDQISSATNTAGLLETGIQDFSKTLADIGMNTGGLQACQDDLNGLQSAMDQFSDTPSIHIDASGIDDCMNNLNQIGIQIKDTGNHVREFNNELNNLDDRELSNLSIAGSIDDDISNFEQIGIQIENTKNRVKEFNNELNNLDSEKLSNLSVAGLNAELNTSEKNIGTLVQNCSELQESLLNAGDAVNNLGTEINSGTHDAIRNLEILTETTNKFDNNLDEAAESTQEWGRTFQELGANADSCGQAIAASMGTALKESQSVFVGLQGGLQGFYGFAKKQSMSFAGNVKKDADSIKETVLHPIKTFRTKIADAIDVAGDKLLAFGQQAEETEDNLDDLGDAGEDAGDSIGDAIKDAAKSFFTFSAGLEMAKAGIEKLKEFAASFINVGIETEQVGAKFNALFSGTDVESWADNFSIAINRNKTQVEGFLVANKSMYASMGITGEAADELSKATTSIAYDLGTAFKMDDAEALSVIQDYIGGNTAALAEYGIQIDNAKLKQTALSMGFKGNLEDLDDAVLAQVRYNALMENSAKIQQAAAGEQEGYANGIKGMQAVWNNFLSGAAGKMEPTFTKLFSVIQKSWTKIEPSLMGFVDILSSGFESAIPVIEEFATNLLPALIESLGSVFVAAAPICDVLLGIAMDVLPPVMTALTPLIDVLGELAGAIFPPLGAIISKIAETVIPPFTRNMKSLSENVIAPFVPIIENIANAILPMVSAGLNIISPLLNTVSPVIALIGKGLGKIAGFLGKIVGYAAGGITSLLEKVAGLFGMGGTVSEKPADIPHNDTGTDNFIGGWTHINEKGGEVAFLPSGSTIIPADKTDKLLDTVATSQPPIAQETTVNLSLYIDTGETELIDRLKRELTKITKGIIEEYNAEKQERLAIQLGNT